MDQTSRRPAAAARGQHKRTPAAGCGSADVAVVGDTPGRRLQMAPTASGTPCTPQECATMMDAVEEAMKAAAEATPESGGSSARVTGLESWLDSSGVQLPTPAAKDLQALVAAAADNKRLRRQLEALREAELEMAAREAEENAHNFAMLEEENLSLAADNAQLQQRLAALEALAAQLEAERPAALHASGDTCGQAVAALQMAAHTSKLSEVYEAQQLVSFQQLDRAEEQLSAVKLQQPGGVRLQHSGLQDSLLQAEHNVQAAAAAAREASRRLALVLAEKEQVDQELRGIRLQLECDPVQSQQHADLRAKLAEAQQALEDEKRHHQRMTSSLLEHAGRLSHKYHLLSDEHGVLQQRYRRLVSTNDKLSSQLKEAHEMLYELQTAVQATPPAKRQERQQLMARVREAEQAVLALQQDKSQLHERLLQAQAFIACLQQRSSASADRRQPAAQMTPVDAQLASTGVIQQQQVGSEAAVTPAFDATSGSAALPPQQCAPGSPSAPAAAAGQEEHPAPADGCSECDTFVTPVKGRSNPAFALPASPAGAQQPAASEPPPGLAGVFPADPVSPILRAAVAAAASAPPAARQDQLQWSAAQSELQHVQQEQLGLREEISRAKSALADIAGQLRASIGASQASSGSRGSSHRAGSAAAAAAAAARSQSGSQGSSAGSTGSSVRRTAPQPTGSSSRSSAAAAPSGPSASTAASGKAAVPKSTVVGIQARRQHAAAAATADYGGLPARAAPAAAAGPDFSFPDLGASSTTRAAAADGSSPQQQQAEEAAATQPEPTSSRRRGQAASTDLQQAADSAAKGSISLEQLIAEAESVSLEQGMLPAAAVQSCGATSVAAGSAAAERDGPVLQPSPARAAQGAGTPAAPPGQQTPHAAGAHLVAALLTPHSVVGSTGAPGTSLRAAAGCSPGEQLLEQQQQLQQSCWFSGPPATPGSAASSAGTSDGRGRAAAAHHHQQQQIVFATPGVAAGAAGDARSAVGPSAASALGGLAAATPLPDLPAATPPGMERVASNFQTPDARVASAASGGPAGSAAATPDAARAMSSGEARSSCQGELVTPPHPIPTAVPGRWEAGVSNELRSALARTHVQRQQQYAGTAVPAASAQSAPVLLMAPTAPGESTPAAVDRTTAGGVDVLQSAVALLATISPAGLMASPAGVPSARILQHLTPEWMRELKRRCAEGTEQVQQLRQQLGLATPEPASQVSPALARGAAAASPAADELASPADCQLAAATAEREAEETVAAVAAVLSAAAAHASPAASAAHSTHSGAVASQQQLQQGQQSCGARAPGVSPEEPGISSAAAGARSAIDKLRRRAIAQAAASASASTDATPEAAAAPQAASSGVVEGSGLAAALATMAAAQGAGDEDLGRSDSAGSLAQYMAAGGTPQGQAPAAHEPYSGRPSSLPSRPDCPTPGSAHSLNPSERASPDVLLLAGLSSSRTMARRLQMQLQRQLERTASLPTMQGSAAGADGGDRRLSSDAEAAGLLASGSGSLAAAAAAAHQEPDSCWPTAAAAASPGVQQPSLSPLEERPSPITPGAALNALSESQLLSPRLQVQLVFDGAAEGQEEEEDVGQTRGPAADSGPANQQMAVSDSEAIGFALAMSVEPEASAAKAAPARPASWSSLFSPGSVAPPAANEIGSPAVPADSATASSSAADPSLSSWAGATAACDTTPSAAAAVSSRPQPAPSSSRLRAAQGGGSVWQPPKIALGDSPSTARPARSRTAAVAASPEVAAPSSGSYSPGGGCVSSCTPSSCLTSSEAGLSLSLGGSPGSPAGPNQAQRQHQQPGQLSPAASCAAAAGAAPGQAAGSDVEAGEFEEVPLESGSEVPGSPSDSAGDPSAAAVAADLAATATPGGISWGSQVVGLAACEPVNSPAGSVGSMQSAAVAPGPAAQEQQPSSAPPGSSLVSGGSSCYATPALAFDSPSGDRGSAACSGSSSHQAFYTVQQSRLPGSGSTGARSAAGSRTVQPGMVEAVAFRGFELLQESPAAPGLTGCGEQAAAAAASPDGATPAWADACDAGGTVDGSVAVPPLPPGCLDPTSSAPAGCDPVSPAPAPSEGSLLQQLLATPGSEGCFSPELACSSQHLQPGSWAQATRGGMPSPASAAPTTGQQAAAAAAGSDSSSRADQRQSSSGVSKRRAGSAAATDAGVAPGSSASSRAAQLVSIPAGASAIAGQMHSPTLSELGFIAAPAVAADVAPAASPLRPPAAGSGAAPADLAGLPFQQRLALLCREEEEGEAQGGCTEPLSLATPGATAGHRQQPRLEHGDNSSLQALEQQEKQWLQASTLPNGQPHPPAYSSSSGNGGDSSGGDDGGAAALCSPELPVRLVCAATQTTPQLTGGRTQQRSWEVRDVQTQVSPALHARAGAASRATPGGPGGWRPMPQETVDGGWAEAGAKGRATEEAAVPGARCDLSASPVKMRDQAW